MVVVNVIESERVDVSVGHVVMIHTFVREYGLGRDE